MIGRKRRCQNCGAYIYASSKYCVHCYERKRESERRKAATLLDED